MRRITLNIILLVINICAYSQLSVTGGYTATQLANNLAGYNVKVSNASLIGTSTQAGHFNYIGSDFNASKGVILTNGRIVDAIGPNNATNTSFNNGTSGMHQLDSLSGKTTYDAVSLKFDFEVQSDNIEFNFIFASEEYNEYVGTAFNDVFAFFISGPGIIGEENLAVVPNTSIPVTINTINNNSYWQYYRDNTSNLINIEFDGLTTLMTAKKTGLIPCNTYTLKICLADASDHIYDAAVFLQENSLIQRNVSAVTNTINADGIALEGCIKASFTFNLDSVMMEDVEIPFGIGGTAVNGVDYVFIDSVFVMPAGQTSASIIIDAYADGITEGQETIELYFRSGPCKPYDTVVLLINDAQSIGYTNNSSNLHCAGDGSGEIDFSITGGFPPYIVSLTDTLTNDSKTYTAFPITNLDAGTYRVKVDDTYGCKGDVVVVGDEYDAGPTFIPDGKGLYYTSTISISDFGAGQILTSGSQIQHIGAVLEHSFMGEVEIKIIAPNGTAAILKERPGGSECDLGEPVAKGPVDAVNPDTSPGVGYEYYWKANAVYGIMTDEAGNYKHTYTDLKGNVLKDKYLPRGSYLPYESFNKLVGTPLNGDWKIYVKDYKPNDNGWIFKWNISFKVGQSDSIITLTEPKKPVITPAYTKPSCGLNNGAINISVTSDFPITNYLWSNGATTQNLTNVAAGIYSVTITDNTGCGYDTSLVLQNSGTLSLSTSHTDVSCSGRSDGRIDLTVNGGTAPYSIIWSNGSTAEDLSGLLANTYTVNVTDNTGCKGFALVDIEQVPDMNLSSEIINETCGEENGNIDLSVQGGTLPYSYNWSNGKTTQDLDHVKAGTYDVTVSDANLCHANDSYDVINLVGYCVVKCDLEITGAVVTNETCGEGNGAIDISVNKGTQPYLFEWSDGVITEDRTGIPAGSYTITITDANGCMAVSTLNVINEASTISINALVSNETCGDASGSIDATVTGGVLPYLYQWNNGAATQDLNAVHAGNYTLTITDANNCKYSSSFEIFNNSGSLTQTYGNVVDEICGNAKGSIDIIISGGNLPYVYSWSNGATTKDLKFKSAGNYQCTVTDASGCKIMTPLYTIINDPGTLEIFDVDVYEEVCSNAAGYINVDIIGGTTPYSFLWSNGGNTAAISNLNAGNYSCTITDKNGCRVYANNVIVINSTGNFILDNVLTKNETCNNHLGSIDVTVSGGASPLQFQWDNGAATEDLFNLSAGNYSAVFTDHDGCVLNLSGEIGNENGTLQLVNQITTDENCGDASGAIDLSITGGTIPYSYLWNTGATTQDIISLTAGSYTCQINDVAGCEIGTSATIENITGSLKITNSILTNEVCGNASGSIDITVSGGIPPLVYNWSNGAHTEDIIGISAGIYTLTLTDNLGCDLIYGPITINNSAPGMFIVTNSVTNESCGHSNGAIDISVSGGVAPYTYLWSTGSSSQDISGLTAGTYSLTATGNNSCSTSKEFEIINQSGSLKISSVVVKNENCGDGSGSINLSVSGGTTPYNFIWNNSATTEDLNSLSAGSYQCTITDANNCTVETGMLNVQNSGGTLKIDNISLVHEQCSDTGGAIRLYVSGGDVPYSYLWNNGETTSQITKLSSGIYTCTITDALNCKITAGSTIENQSGTLSAIAENIIGPHCDKNNGSIDLYVVGGTSPYNFTWNTGDFTEDVSGLGSGSYFCQISDADNCNYNYSADLIKIENDLEIANSLLSDEYCGKANGSIGLTVTGSALPITYLWSNGDTTANIDNLSSGIYVVEVTDNNGCSLSEYYNLPGHSSPSCEFSLCKDNFSSSKTGNIFDSGGPFSNYGNSENCGFLIDVPCATSITLTFTSFSFSAGDYLYVYNGPNSTYPLLLASSGYTIPTPKTSSSNKMYIVLISNTTSNAAGFRASWNAVVPAGNVPVANFTISNVNAPVNTPVNFTDLSSYSPTSWFWNFDDGNVSYTKNSTHIYETSGVYHPTLIVSNCYGSDTMSQILNIQYPPAISILSNTQSVIFNGCNDSSGIPLKIYNNGVGNLVFDISENPTNNWLSFSSPSGIIPPMDSMIINVKYTSSGFYAGTYSSLITINSNDANNPLLTIPSSMKVVGIPEYNFSSYSINFDTARQWTTNNRSLMIQNTGCDTLELTSILSNLAEFTADHSQLKVLPGTTEELIISFTPLTVGNFSGKLTLHNNVKDTSVNLFGVGTGSPVISSLPDSLYVSIVGCDDSATVPFKIFNKGLGGLSYTLSSKINNGFDSVHTAIYTTTGAKTVHQFTDLNSYSDSIDLIVTLNGDFDASYESAVLKIDGDDQGVIPDGNVPNGTDIIKKYSFTSAAIKDWLSDGTLNIEIENNSEVNAGLTGNKDMHRVQLIAYSVKWLNLKSGVGNITPNDSASENVTFKTTGLKSGTYITSVNINSNDPNTPVLAIPATMIVSGQPSLTLSKTSIDFGLVKQWSSDYDTFSISNPGCDTLFVTNIVSTQAAFTVDNKIFSVAPGQSHDVIATFSPIVIGAQNAALTIFNNFSDTLISLSGFGQGSPKIILAPVSLSTSLTGCNDSVSKPFKIYNIGLGILTFSIDDLSGSPWLNVSTQSGIIAIGDSITIQAKIKSGGLNAGVFAASINITSNDPLNPTKAIPVTLTFSGTPMITVSPTTINLGTVRQFTNSYDTITISNPGCATLSITNITTTDADVTVNKTSLSILPGEAAQVIIKFSPLLIKSYSGTLRIFNNAVNTDIIYSGIGEGIPVITVQPDTINVTMLECNDSVTFPLKIYNTGLGILNYNINGSFNKNYDSTMSKIFISSGAASVFAFSGLNTSADSIQFNITLNGDFDGNNEYAELYIDGNYIGVIPDNNQPSGTNIIVPYKLGGANVTNWLSDGALNIKIQNTIDVNSGLTGNMDLHKVQLKINGLDWINMPVNTGTVAVNDSAEVDVVFNSNLITPGIYATNLKFNSNDPVTPITVVPAIFNLIGKPDISTSANTLDFGHVTLGSSVTDSVIIYNDGCDTLEISSITSDLPEFTIKSSITQILPYDSKNLVVKYSPSIMDTSEGIINIYNNDNNIAISAFGIGEGVPVISLSDDSLSAESPDCDDTTTVTLTIFNTGLGQLTFTIKDIKTNSWLQLSDSNGIIPIGDSLPITVDFITSGLNAGFYSSDLVIISNDTISPSLSIPVSFDFSGTPALAVSAGSVDFGVIPQAGSISDTIEITNPGCDTLVINNIGLILPEFTVNQNTFILLPNDTAELIIRFTPLKVDTFTDVVTINSNAGSWLVSLKGISLGSPVISMDPDSISGYIVGCNNAITKSITIYNTGQQNLSYKIQGIYGAGFDSVSSMVFTSHGATTSHMFTSVKTTADTLFMEITLNGDYDGSHEFADLFIDGTLIGKIDDKDVTSGTDVLIPYIFTGTELAGWLLDGKLNVDIVNCSEVNFGIPGNKDLNRVRILIKGSKWLSLPVDSGTIGINDSATLDINMSSANVPAGFYSTVLSVASNDISAPNIELPVSLTINGDPEISLSAAYIDFGLTDPLSGVYDSVKIFNTGCGTLTINNISSDLPVFSTDLKTFDINSGDSAIVLVHFLPDHAGVFNGILSIESNAGNDSIYLTGTGEGGAEISLTPKTISAALSQCSDRVIIPVIISNPGTDTLFWNIDSIAKITPSLEFSEITGIVNAGETDTIYLTFAVNGTPPGTYSSEIVISSYKKQFVSDTINYNLTVTAFICPFFTYEVIDKCYGIITFKDKSSRLADEWKWMFGDGGTSSSQNPIHVYTQTGNYNVSLEIKKNNQSYFIKDTVYVFVPDKNPALVISGKQITDNSVFFEILDNTITTCLWDFGDGSTSDKIIADHAYPEEGLYTVKAYTYNQDSCTNTLITQVNIVSPIDLSIYPNPNNGTFTIVYSSESDEVMYMKMYNVVGVELYNTRLNLTNGILNQTFTFNNLSSGTYLIRLSSPTVNKTFKISIQNKL